MIPTSLTLPACVGLKQARDFCTLVHFRTLSDGTLAQVSLPVEHPAAPRSSKFVRSEIMLAGNFMRAVPGDPSRTEFLMVTHVNPGGAAQTRAGAMLVNSLCTSSPVSFIRRLEAAGQKLMRELAEAEAEVAAGGGDAGVGPGPAVPSPSLPPPSAYPAVPGESPLMAVAAEGSGEGSGRPGEALGCSSSAGPLELVPVLDGFGPGGDGRREVAMPEAVAGEASWPQR